MKILIGNVNTNNIDNLTWCLGYGGLAQMNTAVGMNTQEVNIDDTDDLMAQELGDMILELHNHCFTVTISE
jgi:hypothetical protein